MEQSLHTGTNLKELALNALLEVTRAINDNVPEDSLYKIYKFSMLADFNVRQLALFVKGAEWECRVSLGVSSDFCQNKLPEAFTDLREVLELKDEQGSFKDFDLAIPVLHNKRLLAVVFVGGILSNSDAEIKADTIFLEALTNIILVAIENKKLAARQLEQQAHKKEMEIAGQLQQFLIPRDLPSEDELAITASYLPHKDVGGDYYDYIPLDDDKFILCIADVSGKGIPAALMMSNFQASLRTLVRKTTDLNEIVEDLNEQIKFSGNGEYFITFFIALYHKHTRQLEYINCGHNPPVLYTDGGLQLLDQGTTVLGVFSPLPFNTKEVFEGLSRFTLFCYTDGLSELMNEQGEEFGSERIESIVTEHGSTSTEILNSELMEQIDEFRGNLSYKDDLTLLSCKVG